MFFEEYLRFKKMKDQLSEKLDRQQKIINQPIFIRDIFVSPTESSKSYGEYHNKENAYRKAYPFMRRFINHTESLLNIANHYHETYYCDKNSDKTYTVKKDCLNKITRIAVSEFALYARRPLSLNEFNGYVKAVIKMAQSKQANVHALIGTFAVITADKQILNVCLYVQCGKDVNVKAICKARASTQDLVYKNSKLYSQQDLESFNPIKINAFIGSNNNFIVANDSIFTVKTTGGAEYLQAIEICIDHDYKHAKNLLITNIARKVSKNQELFPEQADHLVTSNVVEVEFSAQLTALAVAHVKPYGNLVPMNGDSVTAEDLQPYLNPNRYQKVTIEKNKNGFCIKNPAFGTDYKLVAQDERPLFGFTYELNKVIELKNAAVKNYIIHSRLLQIDKGEQYGQFIKQTQTTLKELTKFLQSIKKQCADGYMEKLFNTKNYQVKMQVNLIANEAEDILKKISEDPFAFQHSTPSFLNKLKSDLQPFKNDRLIKPFIETIDQMCSTIDTKKFKAA